MRPIFTTVFRCFYEGVAFSSRMENGKGKESRNRKYSVARYISKCYLKWGKYYMLDIQEALRLPMVVQKCFVFTYRTTANNPKL